MYRNLFYTCLLCGFLFYSCSKKEFKLNGTYSIKVKTDGGYIDSDYTYSFDENYWNIRSKNYNKSFAYFIEKNRIYECDSNLYSRQDCRNMNSFFEIIETKSLIDTLKGKIEIITIRDGNIKDDIYQLIKTEY